MSHLLFLLSSPLNEQVQDAIISSGRTGAPHVVARANRNGTVQVRGWNGCKEGAACSPSKL